MAYKIGKVGEPEHYKLGYAAVVSRGFICQGSLHDGHLGPAESCEACLNSVGLEAERHMEWIWGIKHMLSYLTIVQRVEQHATKVMQLLEQEGPLIVPHLLDTDENQGELLRQALHDLAATRGKEAAI